MGILNPGHKITRDNLPEHMTLGRSDEVIEKIDELMHMSAEGLALEAVERLAMSRTMGTQLHDREKVYAEAIVLSNLATVAALREAAQSTRQF